MITRRNLFVLPRERTRITREPDRNGHWTPNFPDNDWVGFANEGGGHVSTDFTWTSNPKERQERESAG